MKKIFGIGLVLLALGACSSKEKVEDKAGTMATEAKKEATEAMTEKKEEMKEGMAAVASKASCVLDQDTRVIEVKKTDGGGCELFYTKFGEAKSVASSGFGTQYCEEVKDRIQSNLDKAGFTCK